MQTETVDRHVFASERVSAIDAIDLPDCPLETNMSLVDNDDLTASNVSNAALIASSICCKDIKRTIEEACKVDIKELFTTSGGSAADRRAFLAFHPHHHADELELLSRWLLMHHVEVCSFQKDGAWGYFRRCIANGQTGIIIVGHAVFISVFVK